VKIDGKTKLLHRHIMEQALVRANVIEQEQERAA
jgi:hypothetical protein